MATTAPKKSPVKRRRKTRSRKKRPGLMARINIGRVLFFLALMSLLLFSVGVVGYVVFFRTVVAAELPAAQKQILFEEPDPPPHIEVPLPVKTVDPETLPRVAIIIDDMGYHRDVGKRLLDLAFNLTFSFLPHAPFAGELEEAAYLQGRQILLHLPLEPRGAEWHPGPGALYLADSDETHRRTLDLDLELVPYATGVNNHMGSKYTEDRAAMNELADMLAERELFFIDSYTTSKSRGMEQAAKRGVPTARRHVFLDNVLQPQAICSQIEKLVMIAEKQGWAIGIGHPYPETLEALTTCGSELLARVRLVGAGDLVN